MLLASSARVSRSILLFNVMTRLNGLCKFAAPARLGIHSNSVKFASESTFRERTCAPDRISTLPGTFIVHLLAAACGNAMVNVCWAADVLTAATILRRSRCCPLPSRKRVAPGRFASREGESMAGLSLSNASRRPTCCRVK